MIGEAIADADDLRACECDGLFAYRAVPPLCARHRPAAACCKAMEGGGMMATL